MNPFATTPIYIEKRFLVDTNVILGYLFKQYPKIDKLIESPSYQFFYTETVRRELIIKGILPRDSSLVHLYFKPVESGVNQIRKNTALEFFHTSWLEKFGTMEKQYKKRNGLNLNDEQLEGYRNDLLTIMEASYSRYDTSVLPKEDSRTPYFLMNNQHLHKKFFKKQETREILEKTFYLMGLEYLIPVLTLEDILNEL